MFAFRREHISMPSVIMQLLGEEEQHAGLSELFFARKLRQIGAPIAQRECTSMTALTHKQHGRSDDPFFCF